MLTENNPFPYIRIYAEVGINWEFLFGVLYEDDCIVILKDLGRYHRYDEDRMFKRHIDKYVEMDKTWIFIENTKKLYEIQK